MAQGKTLFFGSQALRRGAGLVKLLIMDLVAETTALLTMIVSAMVADRDAVRVTASPGPAGNVVFRVVVGPKDKGKVIGKQGRTARSLRIILSSIAKEHGKNYSLDVDGFSVGSEEN